MGWKILFGGLTLGALVVLVVVVAAIVGIWWFVTDDDPLLYYDARPATVEDDALADSGYQRINDTAFNVSLSPVPQVGKDVRVRTWVTVYGKGETLSAAMNGSAGNPTATGPPDRRVEAVDPESDALVTVFSMSALQLGPVAVNPVVYASDPGLLDKSGILIDHAETWLPENVADVTNVDVRSSRSVEMVGQETEMTTFDGQLVLEDGSRADVRLYLARTVRDGELVVVLGIAPPDETSSELFATLVEGVEMGEWGVTPGWVGPDPGDSVPNSTFSTGTVGSTVTTTADRG